MLRETTIKAKNVDRALITQPNIYLVKNKLELHSNMARQNLLVIGSELDNPFPNVMFLIDCYIVTPRVI